MKNHQIIQVIHFLLILLLVLENFLNHNIKCIILSVVEDLVKSGKYKVERIIKTMR